MADLLAKGLDVVGISLADEKQKDLKIFVDELARWNAKVNLTAIDSYRDMIEKHLIDSILLAHHLDSFSKVLDIGSGAGLPIIPLALVRTDLQFYSIESRGKKVHFLNHIKRQLKLHNLTIIQGRSEEIRQEKTGVMDCIVARGVGGIDYIIKISEHLLASEGRWVLMKGLEGRNEMKGWRAAEPENREAQLVEYRLPFSQAERCLLMIKKGCLSQATGAGVSRGH